MKNLPRIANRLFFEPALITPAQHAAYCMFVESHLTFQGQMPEDQTPDKPPAPEMPEDMTEDSDTAIIRVHGTLVAHPEDIAMSECGCSMESLNAAIEAVERDPKIERVIYDFRTPGGAVTMIPETARKIRYSRKETIAFTDSECCSGGIWLAAQCRRFYATGSSRVGSVGVYTMCLDYSKALEQRGVKVNAISAGKFKLLGAYWKELADEERGKLQAGVDKIYAQFKDAMETYRIVSDENFGNGLVFDGEDAAAIGFTDGVVDSLEDVLDGMEE